MKYSEEANFIDGTNSLPNGAKTNERTVKTDHQMTNGISVDKNILKYDDDDDKNIVVATLSETKDDKELLVAALPMETKTSGRRRRWLPSKHNLINVFLYSQFIFKH